MIGLLVTSHGDFCEGIINSMEMISGSNEDVHYLKLNENGITDYSMRLHSKLDQMLKKYDGIVIFSDISGGTPYNECYRYILEKKANVRLIAGANLPMIIETSIALGAADDLNSLVDLAIQSGKTSIKELVVEELDEVDNDLDI